MTGYDIYRVCRSLMGRNTPSLETYLQSSEKPYYEMLRDFFVKEKNLNVADIKNFLRSVYNNDPIGFDPYKLLNEEAWEVYIKWCKTGSTKALYFDEVKKSFTFIENFCINKSIDFNQYKQTFAARHIREKKIDYAVAVHLQLVEIKKLKKVDKLLLKNFISQYNIIQSRLSNPELSKLLTDLTRGMTKLLQAYQKGT